MKTTFSDVFGRSPQACASAPGRVNLLGEHTDYNDGLVLPVALAARTHISAARSDGPSFRVHSDELGECSEFSLEVPPRSRFAAYVYGCLHEFSDEFGAIPALDMHIRSTVPIGAGLSSSAALEVATLRALCALMEIQADGVLIAQMAQRAEVRYANVKCGIMDQMASSLAMESMMLFLDTRTLDQQLIPVPPFSELLVLHSGVERSLAATAYNQRREECRQAAQRIGIESLRDATLESIAGLPEPLGRRVRHVITENARVLAAVKSGQASRLGELMNGSHRSLRDDYEVSTNQLNILVRFLQDHPSVFGAKLTGAGFGGACVALCHADSALSVAGTVLEQYAGLGGAGYLLAPLTDRADEASSN